ncbi:Hypothetical predicted protein [Scomber scombrus]|uniref:Uncharacterized protein n=1 Tax=Scomber scombrus TaxID=13677 RepID=A0AAV1NGT4_SCOSC
MPRGMRLVREWTASGQQWTGSEACRFRNNLKPPVKVGYVRTSGTASETADVCKVPFRREAAAAVAVADFANVSPESDSSECNGTLR